MRTTTWAGLIAAMALVTACQREKTPAEQASEDARAVAMVEAAQQVKAPPVPIEPQPITAADIEQNGFYGAGCTLVPTSVPGGDPVIMANDRRALVKFAGKFVTFAADPGSPSLSLGVHSHYVGKAQSLWLAKGQGDGTALGREGMRWDGRVEIRDAQDRTIWSSAGALTCGS
jgi:hypothetical protein